MKGNIYYAVLSGFCAAAASVFGKLCGLPMLEGYFVVRILFFALMVLCNAGVWTLFVKALHQSESSLIATVASSASNYLSSAIVGVLLFNEVTTLLWWSGLSLIMMGLMFMLKDQPVVNQIDKNA